MSKAILILDMPNKCMECRLKYLDTGANVYCCVWDGSEILKRGKDEWCPLKPMPKRINPLKIDGSNLLDLGYLHGRNDLINEMEGEVE